MNQIEWTQQELKRVQSEIEALETESKAALQVIGYIMHQQKKLIKDLKDVKKEIQKLR